LPDFWYGFDFPRSLLIGDSNADVIDSPAISGVDVEQFPRSCETGIVLVERIET